MTDSQLIQTALASLLVGGGTYGAMRGIRDIGGPPAPVPNSNELEITLPSSKVPKPMLQHNKVANAPEDPNASIMEILARNASRFALPALAVGGGLYGGFQGASKVYDHFENKNIESEQEKAKQQYLQSLQKASVKVGSIQTPHVDKFLNGFIEKFAEQPGFLQKFLSASFGEAKNLGGEGLDAAGSLANEVGRNVAGTDLTGLALAAAGLGTLGVAGGTSYLAHRMDQNKEDAKRKTQLPTEIRLNVQ